MTGIGRGANGTMYTSNSIPVATLRDAATYGTSACPIVVWYGAHFTGRNLPTSAASICSASAENQRGSSSAVVVTPIGQHVAESRLGPEPHAEQVLGANALRDLRSGLEDLQAPLGLAVQI